MPGINDSKFVLVVGATAGIGKALALAIINLPSNPTVIIAGRRQDRLNDIISEHGKSGRLEGIRMDVDTDRASLKKTVEDVLAKYPKVRNARHMYNVHREVNIDGDSWTRLYSQLGFSASSNLRALRASTSIVSVAGDNAPRS